MASDPTPAGGGLETETAPSMCETTPKFIWPVQTKCGFLKWDLWPGWPTGDFPWKW